MLIPDWLMILVALDRVVAIEWSVWYKLNCTTKTAWFPILVVALILAVLGIPQIIFGELIPEIPTCRQASFFLSTDNTFDNFPQF